MDPDRKPRRAAADLDTDLPAAISPGKHTLTSRLQRAPSADAVAASMISQLGLAPQEVAAPDAPPAPVTEAREPDTFLIAHELAGARQ